MRRRIFSRVAIGLSLAVLVLAACGGASAGNMQRGKQIYDGEIPIAGGKAPKCVGCHPVEAGRTGGAGPNLSNIGSRAGSTVKGMDARAYLRQSIVDPDAYLAGGYQEGIHYRGYGKVLTGQQIEDLIAYMLTLRSGQDK